MTEFLILPHVVAGVLATLAAGALAVAILRGRQLGAFENVLAWFVTAGYSVAFVAGGWWYLTHYGPGKESIKAGPIPWAHAVVMETKEHLFLTGLLAAVVLPFVVAEARRLDTPLFRRLAVLLAMIACLVGLMMEGMGAVVSMAVRVSTEAGA